MQRHRRITLRLPAPTISTWLDIHAESHVSAEVQVHVICFNTPRTPYNREYQYLKRSFVLSPRESAVPVKTSLYAMLSHPFYQHEPLEPACFRLLILRPGQRSSPVCCSLVSASLFDFDDISGVGSSSVGGYEAISYVWGDSNQTSEIDCDDAKFTITTNLESALRHFRDTTRTRILWADAICINQKDKVEKAQQVSLMGLIYWKARRVLIWLGPDTEADELWNASKAAARIKEVSRLWDQPLVDVPPMFHLERYKLDRSDEENSAHGWEAVRRLLNRKWFTRVWVVQELGLARDATFYCGDAHFSSDCLEKMYSILSARAPTLASYYGLNLRTPNLGFSYMYSTRGNWRLELGADPAMAESFLEILEMARGLECTDARDTVYAFLGHPAAFKQQHLDVDPYKWYPRNLYNETPTIIHPDYDEGTTAQDVYLRLAYVLIVEWGMGLELLSHVIHDQVSIADGYPSWVPRWHIGGPCTWSGRKQFCPAPMRAYPPSIRLMFDNEGAEIGVKLKAKYLGTVYFALKFPEASRFMISNHATRHADQWDNTANGDPVEAAYSTLEELGPPFLDYVRKDIFVFASTLTGGITRDHKLEIQPAQNHPTAHVQNFHAYRCLKAENPFDIKHPNECNHCEKTLSNEGNRGDAESYSRDLRHAAPCRAFYGTQDGRIGLGPTILTGGDQIWLPIGADMPFILRPVEGETFQVVGQTYLHGVMRGEAVSGLTEDDFQVLDLC